MRHWTALLGALGFVSAFGACTFEPSATQPPAAVGGAGGAVGGSGGEAAQGGDVAGAGGVGAAGGGGVGADGGGGAGGAGATGGSGPTGELVNDGLLVRYFLDEASEGQGPTEALDSGPAPLPLAITYAPELAYVEPSSGHRGLEWTAHSTVGRASAPIDGSALASALQAGSQVTVEVVAYVSHMPTTGWARLLHLGAENETGRVVLAASSLTRATAALMNEERAEWEVDFTTHARAILHLVFDSAAADEADRLRLYHDGALLPRLAGGSGVPQNMQLDLSVGRYLVVGNREEADRGFSGRVYYAAVYSTAFDEAQVLNNTGVLIANDDSPP